ncbi:hypothetical protein K491DRAFT_771452 [Lophiostoma macrostomum CBS 122681]|uniref:FAD-binding FR-type domain-containing protein n=1 Tax=Lophiostoma macrostomum CBS 122681 TaxID=1314788 RepID=A0A6A6SPN2_9PLEO|nr:hypothetical protein K491DRAFT_771452 [Lophiostoma macrostomum CBS 122681]
MAQALDHTDGTRHGNHVRHGADVNRNLGLALWAVISLVLLLRAAQRLHSRWRRRSHGIRRSLRTRLPLLLVLVDRLDRFRAFLDALALVPFPAACGFRVSHLSLGRVLFVVAYGWTVLLLIVFVDGPALSSGFFVDDVGSRAAWVALAQVPFVVLLATKRGPLTLLAGVSYERVIWIHRWAGRGLALAATIHMSLNTSSTPVSEIATSKDQTMSAVRYGVGAYATLFWMVVSSVLPLRQWSFLAFRINHCFSTLFFAGLLFQHIPRFARLPLYVAAAFKVCDWLWAICSACRTNISLPVMSGIARPRRNEDCSSSSFGHAVKMSRPTIGRGSFSCSSESPGCSPNCTIMIRVCNVPVPWGPGQHVRLYLPQLGLLEMHPFTPATCPQVPVPPPLPPRHRRRDVEHGRVAPAPKALPSRDMVLFIRPHKGLTRRLAWYYSDWLSLPCPNSSRPSPSLKAFVVGPYGSPPVWENYEHLILIASSTGVSFILSVVDYLEQLCMEGKLRTRSIHFIWTVRHVEPRLDAAVVELLRRHSFLLSESGVKMAISFYATCPRSDMEAYNETSQPPDLFAHLRRPYRSHFHGKPPLRIRNPDDIYREYEEGRESETETETEDGEEGGDGARSSPASNASSTLIDEDEEPLLPQLESPSPKSAPQRGWWSRILALGSIRRQHPRYPIGAPLCNCQSVHRRAQSCKPTSSGDLIRRHFGIRPDLDHIIACSSAADKRRERTMVAVCSNGEVAKDARKAVSRLKLEYAMGRREGNVDVYTECFG